MRPGSVRARGEGQLITRNPVSGAAGVKVRRQEIDLEAVGRVEGVAELPAVGWQVAAESVSATLHLPPGWRLLALFRADRVDGDWLTQWTLLDLFLLMVFTVAVTRLRGFGAGMVACLAFGLSYHEAGAPRFAWLALLVPIALLGAVRAGRARRWLRLWQWVSAVVLVLVGVPFVAAQVQQALYPQLESTRSWEPMGIPSLPTETTEGSEAAGGAAVESRTLMSNELPAKGQAASDRVSPPISSGENLMLDARARIQTGPGVPEWKWRRAEFGWNGPVSPEQRVRMLLVPPGVQRVLTWLRVALTVALGVWLLRSRDERAGARSDSGRGGRAATVPLGWLAALAIGFGGGQCASAAEIPTPEMLELLKERLLEPSDAFPAAADVPWARLWLESNRVRVEAEIHTAARVAVPLPGHLTFWTPVRVRVDGEQEPALRRDDGFLWVALDPGVHRVEIDGLIPDRPEWEWAFRLRPRRVEIEAPGWAVSGVRADGVPEGQVFFSRQQQAVPGVESTYERQDFEPVARVERRIELGLVWRVQTTVVRLSPPGKAFSLRVPLLPGETVLSEEKAVREGAIEVRFAAGQMESGWEGELPVAPRLKLETRAEDAWVERWRLVVSPVWSVALAGLAPWFERKSGELERVWQPWPGERVELEVGRPESVEGPTVTVLGANHTVRAGKRQQSSALAVRVRCSLGQDFPIGLPVDAAVSSLTVGGRALPVRRDAERVVVPLQPGDHTVELKWTVDRRWGARFRTDAIRFPVRLVNLTTEVSPPGDRWVLFARGPLRGPAVRFWVIVVCAMGAGALLGRVRGWPLGGVAWTLLALGLTQVEPVAGLVVVAWFLYLRWRGAGGFERLPAWFTNLLQTGTVPFTLGVLSILVVAVGRGLLGQPEMFIVGNGSTAGTLRWFEARSEETPMGAEIVSVSVWWYRLLMLVWALWLAFAILGWLRWAWACYCSGGC